MGIRFSCPNGHRLNVKAFLAGKRAKCPHCGAKVRVPRTSNGAAEAVPMGPSAPLSASLSAAERTAAAEDGPTPTPLPAQWYVRFPSGGQYGPATDNVVADWIRQGRVSPDDWVWREGWTDWQPAEEALAHLGMKPAPLAELADFEPVLTVAPAMPTARSTRLHRPKQDRTVVSISVLAFAAIVLFAILIWILTRTG